MPNRRGLHPCGYNVKCLACGEWTLTCDPCCDYAHCEGEECEKEKPPAKPVVKADF